MAFHSVGVYVDVHDGVSFLVRGFEERSPVPLGILDISVESIGCIFNFLEILLESHWAFCDRVLEDVTLRWI